MLTITDLVEQKYLSAIELINENKYVEALSILETIADYKDSAEKIAEYSAIVEAREFEFALEMFVGEYIPVVQKASSSLAQRNVHCMRSIELYRRSLDRQHNNQSQSKLRLHRLVCSTHV